MEPSCSSCHGFSGQGERVDTPRLAGQKAEYLEKTLLAYKNGVRANDIYSRMRFIASKLIQRCERMRLLVRRSEIEGTLSASPSKSYTHRAMVLGLLGNGTSRLTTFSWAETPWPHSKRSGSWADRSPSRTTAASSGAAICLPGRSHRRHELRHHHPHSGRDRLIASMPHSSHRDESIRRRPMQPLISALREMGVECCSTRGNGLAPLIVKGPNKGPETHIPGTSVPSSSLRC